MDTSVPPSPHNGVLTLVQTEPDWQPIFHASNQVVLYNATSHALSIRRSSTSPTAISPSSCPLCKRPLPAGYSLREEEEAEVDEILDTENDDAQWSRATNYFQLLAIANDTMSRPSSPPSIAASSSGESMPTFSTEALAEGYFNAFFKEERRLGMGANGSVFLCQHRLDGNPLGYFAVKKIAVGQSHSYLVKILREVRLLERLHHRNIITYHHAWLETYQFSAFGPKVPTLHVLMEWADGGSLDDFIDARLGRPTKHIHIHPVTPVARTAGRNSVPPSRRSSLIGNSRSHFDHMDSDLHSRSARIRAFRAYQRATPAEKEEMKRQTESSYINGGSRQTTWTPVHLLSAEEVKSLFSDVVSGLAFLHDRSILHLDLKPGNVLLTWDEGSLIPRAMLSDFGTSRDMLQTSPTRSGNTGTLEYTSPESLPSPTTGLLQQVDSKADMWSLGMILHKLLFFKLPYRYAAIGDSNGEPVSGVDEHEKMDRLEKEILGYAGFKPSQDNVASFEARRLPRAFLVLLESLLSITPSGRPSSERVSNAIREGKLDPLQQAHPTSLVSVTSRLSNVPASRLSSVQSDADPHTGAVSRGHSADAPLAEAEAEAHSESPNGKTPVLGVPPHQVKRSTTIPQAYDRVSPSRIPPLLIKRTVKSSLLVAKVLHVTTLCPLSQLHIVPLSIILSAAVIDTWFDNHWITALFGAFHLAAVKVASHNNLGCV
ncbi:putative serine/threonine-protein kinase iks1 [Pleurotus pulmonarius]|nr:putative serine/threonine-protein kinase iks1 [Pleurotus pulmonarius]KAF4582426.1 putative serine/threonine-protein kinase iks1 [Pleurotus pulmonarius]